MQIADGAGALLPPSGGHRLPGLEALAALGSA